MTHRNHSFAILLNKPMRTDQPVVFTHIPKTAGSSINRAAENVVGIANCAIISNIPIDDRLTFLKNCLESRKKYIGGHFRYFDAQCFFDEANFVVSLRDPIERILSTYFMFLRNNSDAEKYKEDIRGSGFEKFYKDFFIRRKMDNLCCKFICNEADRKRAADIIYDKYSLVWSSDSTDAAWPMIFYALTSRKDRIPPLTKKNTAPIASTDREFYLGSRPKHYHTFLNKSCLDMIIDTNREDIELYQWFLDIAKKD